MEDPAAVAAREVARKAAEQRRMWAMIVGGGVFAGIALVQFLRDTKDAVRAARRPKKPWDMV